MKLTALVFPLLITLVFSACDQADSEEGTEGGNQQPVEKIVNEKSPIITGELIVSGTLANGKDASNISVTKNQKIEVVRGDGLIVGSATSDENGAYQMKVAEGGLLIDSEFSLTGSGLYLNVEGLTATGEDFSYTLESRVPDDGSGIALGLKKRLNLTAETLGNRKTGTVDVGSSYLKEVSSITGTVAFADSAVTKSAVDIYIPGKNFFVRTGDDGKFSMLFVPVGVYSIRIQKGIYVKDVSVTVAAGKTARLTTVTVALDERNPFPLSTVLMGNWASKCYYYDMAGGIDPETPVTGTITITSMTQISSTGSSCLMRTMAAISPTFTKLITLGDGALVMKDTGANTPVYFFNKIVTFTNDRIVIDVDSNSMGSTTMIEVLERTN